MRLPINLTALLAMLLLGFTVLGGTGVGAQDSIEAEGPQIEELDGIQHAVSRFYTMDYSAMMESMSTPGAEMTMPEGIISVSGVILEFDEDGQAEDALNTLNDEVNSEDGGMFGEGTEVEEVDLDLGDTSKSYKGAEDIDGQTMDFVVSIVQKDNYLYFVTTGGSAIDVEQVTKDFTNTLIDNDGSGEGEFKEDGTSTGGLWDKFPAADDELIAGLLPSDMVLYPVPATPEA